MVIGQASNKAVLHSCEHKSMDPWDDCFSPMGSSMEVHRRRDVVRGALPMEGQPRMAHVPRLNRSPSPVDQLISLGDGAGEVSAEPHWAPGSVGAVNQPVAGVDCVRPSGLDCLPASGWPAAPQGGAPIGAGARPRYVWTSGDAVGYLAMWDSVRPSGLDCPMDGSSRVVLLSENIPEAWAQQEIGTRPRHVPTLGDAVGYPTMQDCVRPSGLDCLMGGSSRVVPPGEGYCGGTGTPGGCTGR